VFLAGVIQQNGGRLLKDLRATLGPNVRMLAPDGFLDAATRAAGVSAEGLTVSVAGTPISALPARGKAFVSQFERAVGVSPETFTVNAAQAAQVLLDAIARSDGTRRSVTAELFKTRVRNGILGDFAITPTGDTNASAVTIYRIQDGKQRLLRVLTPPASLVARARRRGGAIGAAPRLVPGAGATRSVRSGLTAGAAHCPAPMRDEEQPTEAHQDEREHRPRADPGVAPVEGSVGDPYDPHRRGRADYPAIGGIARPGSADRPAISWPAERPRGPARPGSAGPSTPAPMA
jgi:hypothetical protein